MNKNFLIKPALILLCIIINIDLFPQTFVDTGITLTGVQRSSSSWCDYDRDGDMDILITGDNISKIYRNDGSNTFNEQTGIVLEGIWQGSVSWGDYDNNGYPDILMTGYSSSGTISKVYRNNGDNTFTEQTTIVLKGVGDSSTEWGDYDNDGDQDILLTGNGYSRIYSNNGDNTFTWQTSISLQGISESSVAWGDYDRDGDLDILLTGGDISKIYRNNGNNTFSEQTSISLIGISCSSVDWGDYDNDGYLDILLTGNDNSGTPLSKIYRNNGDNSFSEQTDIGLTGVNYGSAVWGDYNNDGYTDILLTGSNYGGPVSKVYKNNGNNTFTEQTDIILTAVYNSRVAWGDYNNDGKLDILLTGDTGSVTVSKIYQNAIATANTAPAAPAGLSATSDETSVTLQWSSVTGDATPAGGMSYNVRVGTSPGGNDVVSPMSLTAGSHLLPVNGNDGSNTSYVLKNPPKATLYWSVQAIDNGFLGGAFADEQSLTYSVSLQASHVFTDSIKTSSVILNWTRGNGSACVVFGKKGNSGSAAPEDGTTYTPDPAFGTGSQIGSTGWFCVYSGNGSSVNVVDLEPATYYVFQVIEFQAGPAYYFTTGQANPITFRTTTFVELTGVTLESVTNCSSAWCDYDRDGDLDILLTGNGISKIYRNDGSNTFNEQTGIVLEGVSNSSVAWGDFNNDGYPDILLTGDGPGYPVSKVYRNNGNNTFSEQTSIVLIGVSNSSVAWSDYDNDGDQDILLTGNGNSRIYSNNGDNTFTYQAGIILRNVNRAAVDWADYDRDGDLDILLIGWGWTNIYRNNGNNTFTDQTSISIQGVNDATAAWGDYDNDGYPDIVLAGWDNSQCISKIYHNNGGNSFTELTGTALTPVCNGSVDWGDFDNDGYLDILLAGWGPAGPVSIIYSNNGNSTFSEQTDINLKGVGSSSVSWGDYNNDGKLDILLTGDTGSGYASKIYQNATGTANIAPAAPPGLSATGVPTSVAFQWSGVTEDATPAGGMSYNLRIGTSPGGSDVISPMSLVAGSHLLPNYGNVGSSVYYTLKNPPKATLYWSVQAVDNGLMAGAFAAEQSIAFSISLQASRVFADSIMPSSLRLNWTRGNGSGRVVFAKKGNSGTATPENGMTYTANTSFGSGSQIGTSGWYCVYNGTGSGVEITGLEPLTNYIFQVIEYDAGNIYFTETGQSNPVVIQTNAFIEQTDILLQGISHSYLAWGDYDRDGDLDIVLTGDGMSKIYRNEGSNTFTEQAGIIPETISNSTVAWGDYDNDGYPDILLTGDGPSGPVSKVYHNNENNTFTVQTSIILQGISNGAAEWGDYDNDGDQDILLVGNGHTRIYSNNGDNTFTWQAGITIQGASESSAAWGDCDNDGDLDVLLTGWNSARIFRNNGDNTFIEITGLPLHGVSWGSASWGDYDNDGWLDILLAGNGSSKVYRNNHNNTFSEQTGITMVGTWNSSAAWGDFDNDGYADILLTGWGPDKQISKVYRNNGNNTFSEQTGITLTGINNGSASWGDYNNDGKLDILLSGDIQNGGVTKIYQNNYITSNAAPAAPAGLSTTSNETSVTLQWNKVIGDATPADGMSYNVRIGTTPGGSDVVSPLSLTSGSRLLPKQGNAQSNTFYILKNPPKTTFYWSIQAIDNGLMSGPFAAEQSFTYSVSLQASNVFADSIRLSSVQLKWTRGNGSACAVFAKKANTGTAVPVNSTVYTANTVFGSGQQIATSGWYCVYNGTGSGVKVTGLEILTDYIFLVIEYDAGPVYYAETGNSNPAVVQTNAFEEQTGIVLQNMGNTAGAWADYDKDGDPDILLTGDGMSRLYLNNGDNTFTEQAGIIPDNFSSSTVAWGDFNNDGYPDILITGDCQSGQVSRVYRNNGDNTFTWQTSIVLPGINNGSTEWGDYDSDGDQDILLAGNGFSRIYSNNGDNTFTWQSGISLPGISNGAATWGDYDNDSDPDVLLSGWGFSKIFRNNGDRTFTEQTGISLQATNDGASAAWGDYDNDGYLDILLTGLNNSSGQISKVYHNNGDNTFTEQTGIILTGINNGSSAWGDFDNDGFADILLSGYTATRQISKIYRNNGDGTFSEQTGIVLAGAGNCIAAWGDYNNDGKLDILLSGDSGYGGISKIYKNSYITSNTAPGTPSGLSETTGEASITLQWGDVTGDATTAEGMSYNVRIGNTPGGSEVVSPMSLASGSHLIPRRGNVWSGTSFILKNPAKTTFYWSVQAVDNGLLAGAFAGEQSFNYSVSLQASNVFADSIKPYSVRLNWTRGNGSACVVLAKKGNSGTATPENGIIYTANPVFGNGSQIGTSGWYCIYNGTGSSVKVTGLEALTDYVFQVIEYDAGPSYFTETGQANPAVVQSNAFEEQTGITLQGVNNSSSAWADYDRDGDLDILLTGDDVSKIYRNNGNNTFTEQTGIILQGVNNSSVAWGDYDNDGYPDILLSGCSPSGVISRVYRNNGNNTFTEQTSIALQGVCNGSVSWADYDNDGDPDILLSGSGITRIYSNNGDNTFTWQTGIVLQNTDGSSAAWSDYDRDGDPDLLLTGWNNSRIYRNNGNNFFTDQTGISLETISQGSVAWGDYDNDGNPDILLTGYTNSWVPISKIYHNNGNNSFSELAGTSLTGVGNGSVAWGDFDNDGYPDILLTGYDPAGKQISKVYHNNGNSTFSEQPGIVLKGVGHGSAAWGDYTNDGKLDFMLTGYSGYGGISGIYQNFITTSNSAPAAPTGLSATGTEAAVTFQWSGVSGDATPTAGMSYNVRIGTTPGGSEIVSPMSLTSGSRLLPDQGNAWYNTQFILKKPEMATLYWSVQAIDKGLLSGPFSAEQTFTYSFPLQASNVFADSINPSFLKLNWTRGNGSGCLVFVKKGDSGSAIPVNSTVYLANTVFGSGTQIGSTGWYCVYNGTGASVRIMGLEPLTNYVYHVIEFDTGPSYFTQTGQANPVIIQSNAFAEQTDIILQGVNNNSIAWCDYDRDGDLDIILTGDGMTKIYRNEGVNTFIEQTTIALQGVSSGSVAWGDYDNDGYPDILLTGDSPSGPVSRVYRNNGNNTFTDQASIVLIGVSNSSVAWGDYNNDGNPDILLSGHDKDNNGISRIYRNNGDNTFTWQEGISLYGVSESSVAWGDYDNDGDLDILLTGWSSSRIYCNNGDNTFTELSGITLYGVSWGSTAWGDYDNDGYLDILMTGNGISKVYRNSRNNTFSEQTGIILPAIWQGNAVWGDYDNDGYADILLTGYASAGHVSKVYRNNGNNTFTEQTGIVLKNIGNGNAVWGDYNNDGKLDILLSGDTGNGTVTKIYQNSLISSNAAPAAPGGLSATSNETSIIFKWNRVTGDATPAKGMSYNVRIGTTPGGSDMVAPMSLASGKRLVPEMGNVQSDTLFILKNPKKGTYYGSVQAIDNGFYPGAFAVEQSITYSYSVQASYIHADSIKALDMIIRWNRGNGSGCVVFAKKGDSGSAVPANGTTYTADPVFGNGSQIGATGWYCIYNGTGINVKVSGLEPLASYIFHVIEFETGLSYYTQTGQFNPAVLKTNLFAELTRTILPGIGGHCSSAWGDYDRDGDLDILLTGYGISKIYRNDGSNTFNEQTGIILEGVSASSASWGDYDNDGYLDILLTGWSNNGYSMSKIYRNNGDNTFTWQSSISLTGVVNGAVAWGDYDNDGDLDVLLTGSRYSKIYRNNGDNTFTEQTAISLTGVDSGTASWGDYDNDGDLDILMTGQAVASPVAKIFRNNGDNTFSEQTGINLEGINEGSAKWGDYDNDSYLDFFVAGQGRAKLFHNNGNNTFTEQTGISIPGINQSSATWGDYDNDGFIDILLSGNENTGLTVSKIFRNNGNKTFSEQTDIILPGVSRGSVDWGDYDNDGKLDILLTGDSRNGSISKIYKNYITKSNAAPAAPSGLSATTNETSVILRWNRVTGDETPAKGMSYNVRIGTSPGGSDVVSTMSLTSGSHLLSGMGNAQCDTMFILKYPDKVTYYWSVQAIDNGLKPGPFATEQTIIYSVRLQASQIIASDVQASQLSLTWRRGNGSSCMVFAKKGDTGSPLPSDGITYTSDPVFGNGSQIGTSGWYCVYNGTSTNVSITGLEPLTNYIFQVIEYETGPSYYTQSGQANPIVVMTNVFAEQTSIILPGVSNSTVAWGDYDNDGDLDILLTGVKINNERISKIHRNDGSNTFAEQTGIILQGVMNGSGDWGDYDNDGDLDILLTGEGISKIYRNNGNNTFSEQTGINLQGVSESSVAWADYDNDGYLDILLSGNNTSGIAVTKIYRNNGNNSFTEQTGITLPAIGYSALAWGDYDNDGYKDILLGNSKIYRNNGNNTFTEQTNINLYGVGEPSVAWGDYDNDGYLDILLSGTSNPESVSKIYRNNGNNTFSEQTGINLKGINQGSGCWGDFDNDGNLDILLTGGGFTKIYHNEGDNTFTEYPDLGQSGLQNSSAAWGDYNKDGKLDILLSGQSANGYITKIYRNLSGTSNIAPEAPAELSSTINETSVILKWNRVTGDATPSKGMSYNVRVGTSPGGSNVVSPMSLASGSRLLQSLGNTHADSLFILKNPKKTTYYWSVQAIDNGFLPGLFAAEQSLTYSLSVQASNVFADSIKPSSLRLNWTRGNGSGCVVFAKNDNSGMAEPVNGTAYSANPVFGNGTQIGTSGWYCVYSGTGISVNVTGITTTDNYIFHVIEFESGPSYYTQTGQANPFILLPSILAEQTGINLPAIGNRSSASWGDYDRDGDLDILLAGDGISKIYQNDGNNVFSEQTGITLPGIWQGSAAWGDYDNDGDLDILLTGYHSSVRISKVYRNNGNSSFTEQTGIILTGVGNSAVAWADFNSDGLLDISLTGDCPYGSVTQIYRNNGNNSFTEQPGLNILGVNNGSIEWGDYDHDGDPDILLTGNSTEGTISRIYSNNGDNTFTYQSGINLTGVGEGTAKWGDYDNDSNLDIILSGNGITKIYRNNGNSTFSEQTGISLQAVHQTSIAWGDYDNDGFPDIFLTGNNNSWISVAKIYHNNGDNTFSEQTDINLTGICRGSAAWGDYNNDGRLDLLMTGEKQNGERVIKIYRNYSATVNITPASPAGLSLTSNETSIILRWNRVAGDVTPPKGMSYNVRIGTSSGGYNAVSPMSLSSGSHMVSKTGNAWSDTLFILKNPKKATYYCSVQAIDNGLLAGSFGSEQSIVFSASVQASKIIADSIQGKSLKLLWERGNGSACIVFAKKGSDGTALPVNGTLYTADQAYGNGTQIGASGWYCVYSGTGNGVKINNLEPATSYIFHVIEFEAGPVYYTQTGQGNPFTLQTNMFTEMTGISLPGIASGTALWGDYDNDNDLDILLTGLIINNVRISKIYRNDGGNKFTEQTSISFTPLNGSSAAWGDYDNDGDLDLLLTGYNGLSPVSKIYRNNGDNTFAEQSSINLPAISDASVSWADYDNDGHLDILLSGNTGESGITKVFRNYGDNTFIEQTSIVLQGLSRGSTAWGDYDNDGDPDILLTGGNSSRIYCNNGNNTFTDQSTIYLRGLDGGSVAWGDYDNDGDLDILYSSNGASLVYRNNGNNTFEEQTSIILQGVHETSAAWGDYDNDGYTDILLAGYNDSWIPVTRVYKNNGNNTFTAQNGIILTGVGDPSVAWGDYDNDGKLDILLTGNTKSILVSKVYRNDCLISNTAPSAPAGLSVTSNETSVILKWNRVSGDATSSRGMSYNVRIGTSPGGSDVVSPMSLTSGLRLLPALGNAQSDTAFFLKYPKKITYYCSVQAIDNGFSSGPFASEQSITYTYSLQASQVIASNIRGSTLNLNWNRGNGSACLVFAKKSEVGSASPVDNTTYIASQQFGAGSQIGTTGWYCIYNGTGNKVTVTGLEALTKYTFHVAEYDAGPKYDTRSAQFNPAVAETGLFDEQTGITIPALSQSSTAWGDYDNDGDFDLLLTGLSSSGNLSKIFRNEGSNVFAEQTSITLMGVSGGSSAWGDYDNDGDIDILLTGSGYSKIYRNNGNNSFSEQTGINLLKVQKSCAAWGDYNNDGFPDILLTGNSSTGNISKVYRNNGDNTFTDQTGIVLQGVSEGSSAWGDYDNDGDLDILLTGTTNGSVSGAASEIYRNNGDNTFTEQSGITLLGVYQSAAEWNDYDSDGDLDIMITGSSSIGYISRIYRNNGDYTFTLQTTLSFPGIISGTITWGDFTNDGNPDIILTGTINGSASGAVSRFYRNNGDNTFNEMPGIVLSGVYLSSAEAGDYDMDGNPDLLLTGSGIDGNPIVKLYRNLISIPNNEPAAPTGLTTTSSEASILFRWKRVSGDATPSMGIGYNIRIGTSPGGSDVVSPMSLSSGSRLVPDYGNSRSDSVFVLKSPKKITYYWSVQAVDNGFNPGPFSAEQSVTYTISVQASRVIAASVEGTNIDLEWTRGNGSACVVFAKKTNSGSALPVDGDTYSADANFGAGTEIGTTGWYCVYYGTDNFVNVRNLESLTYYTFHVIEFDPGPVYDTRTGLENPLITKTGLFDEQTGIAIQGITQGSVSWGDYDSDENPDILITGSGYSRIYHNNSDNTFAQAVTMTGVFYSSAAWSDYDNDGDIDILVTGSASSKIYRNDGGNTLTEQTAIILAGVSYGSSAWGDYDNDGDPDILLTGRLSSGEGVTKIYLNNGNDTFSEQTRISLPNVYYSSVAWGDYDNDGFLDILLSGTSNGLPSGALSKVYRNNGDNSFTVQSEIILQGVYQGSAAWIDYDSDGDLDILLSGSTGISASSAVSKIYRNNGENSFTEQTAISLHGVYQSSAAWGDLDNNGYPDILLTGRSASGEYRADAYLNDGENNFTEQESIRLTGVIYSSAELCDYNKDGKLDLLLSGQSGNGAISKIYRNTSTGSNSAPATPIGLTATETETSLILKWNRVTGDATPAGSIIYNVRVGTSPGIGDIVSSMSTASGSSLIPDIGNARSDTLYILRYPQKTTYYWSVQSVDNGFMTSPFAAEQTFVFTSSVQASLVYADNIQGSSVSLTWRRGNGTACMVFAKEGGTGIAEPADGTDYTAGQVYGSGTQIGTSGWYCVYKGTGNNTVITGLTPMQTYSFQVTEYEAGPAYYTQSGQGNPVAVRTGLFAEQTGITLPGVTNSSSAWGDYDNDGDLDIVITGNTSSGRISKIFRNNGNNSFTENTGVSLPGIGYGSVAWGDYDNDGDIDLLLTGTSNGSPSGALSGIFRNNGNSTFTEQSAIALPGAYYSSAAWGDYDNDGWLDILITGTNNGLSSGAFSKIFRNNGDNTFTEQTGIDLQGVCFSSVVWGDYDNDNDLDILMAGSLLSKIYRNNGNNSFTEQTGITLPGINNGSVAWGDYDNDGDLDILITGSSSSGYNSKIFRNNGDNTFTAQNIISITGISYGSGNWGDYDNDGLLDILITGRAGNTSSEIITEFYHNNGNNSFTEQTNLSLEGVYNSSVAWGDYNNDGKLDILLTGQNSSYVPVSRIYRNLSAEPNTPPGVPTGLSSAVSDTSIILSWTKANDDNTPAAGISYNIRIGSSSGANDIVPSMSLNNGTKLFPGIGNAQSGTSFLLNYPKKATYYWSVQAVDHGFASGAFSEEKTFVF
ncbi:MAG: VCBS repeat-containing protein [Bacteroidia bacterium]|nr:VCBS repeat-containing protein [Bacteroidia bacterium]